MSDAFFERPILNSPYDYPSRHWELDEAGQPTERTLEYRRRAKLISPIPQPKKRRNKRQLDLPDSKGRPTEDQRYDPTPIIDELRGFVDEWRALPSPRDWGVTPETARLLDHWRNYPFQDIRPFFCQVEAVETAIWLTEVAPRIGPAGKKFADYLSAANEEANPGLARLALKLATGAGKTTVMAMLIAWQTVNAVRRPASKSFTKGFLIVAPGLTIRDRLRVLQPNDPDSYFKNRELLPNDMLSDLDRAKIVITNFHAFKLRERVELTKGGRSLLQGRGPALETRETEGQMLQRVMPELMAMKHILVLNDEAHHCYREKPAGSEEGKLVGDDRKEAKKNTEAARLESIRAPAGGWLPSAGLARASLSNSRPAGEPPPAQRTKDTLGRQRPPGGVPRCLPSSCSGANSQACRQPQRFPCSLCSAIADPVSSSVLLVFRETSESGNEISRPALVSPTQFACRNGGCAIAGRAG